MLKNYTTKEASASSYIKRQQCLHCCLDYYLRNVSKRPLTIFFPISRPIVVAVVSIAFSKGDFLLREEEREREDVLRERDEDEYVRLMTDSHYTCPYYRNGDEYAVVRKQI